MTDRVHLPEKRFFRELEKRWKRLTPDICDVWLFVCGRVIRIRFGGSVFFTLLSTAFAHLIIKPEKQADLTILACSGNKLPLPELPFSTSAFGQRCELTTDPESGIEASFMMGPDILSMLDHEQKTAIYWIRDAGTVPAFEQAAPFRHLFHWYLRRHGWILVHAAAIGQQNRGILLCGKGGSGKSTLATATWNRKEWQFAGDDYCAVSLKPPHIVAPVYPSAKLTIESSRMLNLDIPEHSPTDGEKSILFAPDSIPNQLPNTLKLVGLVIPSRRHSPAFATQLTPVEATRHLAISTLYQMPHAGEKDLQDLTRIARTLPAWRISVPQGRPQDALKRLGHLLEKPENYCT
ncbi:MAG: hypothetical protein GXO70_01620 [Acidobacteria bacterium]|nr:hypothetical protein [Acidobacteriota bacterium]